MIVSLILFLIQSAYASPVHEEWYFSGSLGVFSKDSNQVKNFNFGRSLDYLGHPIKLSLDVGFFFDNRPSRNSSLTTSLLVGPEIMNDHLFFSFFSGPGVIVAPDKPVGGPFQFFHEATIGIVDKPTNFRIGVSCRHYSNAGIYSENNGRDFCGLKFFLGW